MTKVVLTKRGRIVRGIVIAALLVGGYAFAMNATTPEQCRVDVEQLSEDCKTLLFP